MKGLKKILGEGMQHVLMLLEGKITEIPSQPCECGKPVVFVQGSKKFNCTKCGAKWKLEVNIIQTKKSTESIE